ncbi:MAG: hypothetical protein PHE83_12485 [Opitutaceae bacterium]|nr:hypothetical protein [Opitutaceae bacterium]
MSFVPLISKALRPGAGRMLALCLLTAAIWCWQHDRLTWASWSVPLDYTGDSLENLARIKAAAEGDLAPFRSHVVRRLGAPFGADWNEYPGSDDLANHGLGLLARMVGVPAASNLALLLAVVTSALSFYLCARLLRLRWEWAFAGALLFAFSFFNLTRGLPHLWLTFTYTIPLALLTCGLIAGARRATARPAWRWLCYGTAAVLGASNPYNLFLYLQLLAWAVLARWLHSRGPAPHRRDRSAGVRLGLACGVLAVLVFAAIHAHVWLAAGGKGGLPLLARNYAGTEIYALKPIELFLPSNRHHGAWLAAIGNRYVRWSDWRGETFSPYLGLVGAAGLLWLAVVFARGLLERRRRLPGPALPALWILLFSVIGGVNSMLAFYFGLGIFRASNRNSVFLLALALLFVVARLSRLTRTWRPAARLGAAGLLVTGGLWDQLPVRMNPEAGRHIAEQVGADRRLGEEMEKRLGAGALVFQLPVLDFPEGRPRHRLNEYDHFRPYLVTRTLRFSYGTGKNRAAGAWQHEYAQLAPAALVRALEDHGFAALYINRQGYPDGAGGLLAGLAAAGRAETIGGPDHDAVIVLLHPAEHPPPPLARSFTFGRGWNPRPPREEGLEPRWTFGTASLCYDNPLSRPLPVTVRFVVSGEGGRTLRILVNGREQANARLDAEPREITLPAMELQPGANCIDLVTPEPAIRVTEQRWSLRAVGLHQLQLEIMAGPASVPGDESETAGKADDP